MNAVNVCRQELGNESSVGRMGVYHHLQEYYISMKRQGAANNLPDIIPNNSIREFRERRSSLRPEFRIIQFLPRV